MIRVTGVKEQTYQEQRVTDAARALFTGHNLREALAQARKDLYHPYQSKGLTTKYGSPAIYAEV